MKEFLFTVGFICILSIACSTEYLRKNESRKSYYEQDNKQQDTRSLHQKKQRQLQALASPSLVTQMEIIEQKYALEIPGLRYVSIFVYLMGFRIAGLQTTFICQLIQLYQRGQQIKYFDIGQLVHGINNAKAFTLKGFGYGLLFQKLNFMWQLGIVLFMVGILIKYVIGPFWKQSIMQEINPHIKKQLKNIEITVGEQKYASMAQQRLMQKPTNNSNMTQKNQQNQGSERKDQSRQPKKFESKLKSLRSSGLQTRQSSMIKESMIKSKLTTNIEQSAISFKNKMDASSKKLISPEIQSSKQIGQSSKMLRSDKILLKHKKPKIRQKYQQYKKLVLVGNILLKQVVLNLIIGELSLMCYCLIKQILLPQEDSQTSSSVMNLSFSACMIAVTEVVMLLFVFNLMLEKETGSGQNREKFRNKIGVRMYWGTAMLQRSICSTIIALDWQYGIAVVAGIKLILLIANKFYKMFHKSSEYYRNLVTSFIHLLILLILALDKYYLHNVKKFQLSQGTIAWVLLFLLVCQFMISLVFIFKDIGLWVKLHQIFQINQNTVQDSSILEKQKTVANIFNQNEEDSLDDSKSRRVKFKQTPDNNALNKFSKMSQKSIVHTVNQAKQKNLNEQTDISESIYAKKSQQLTSKLQINSKISSSNLNHQSKTQMMIKKGFSNGKAVKLYSKTQKQVNTSKIDDAIMAQKTQKNVIFDQSQEHGSDNNDAEMVSIQLQSVKKI